MAACCCLCLGWVIGLLVCGFVCDLVGCWFDCVCTFALWFVAYEWLLCCFGFGGMLQVVVGCVGFVNSVVMVIILFTW